MNKKRKAIQKLKRNGNCYPEIKFWSNDESKVSSHMIAPPVIDVLLLRIVGLNVDECGGQRHSNLYL